MCSRGETTVCRAITMVFTQISSKYCSPIWSGVAAELWHYSIGTGE